MKRNDLFNEVKNWLEAEKLVFSADSDNATFDGGMATANGMVQVCLHCEGSPPILQVVCALPLKVPKEKTADTALFLHHVNACLRIGAFYFNLENRLIAYRLTMPVRPEADLGHQFAEAFATAIGTWDDYLAPLALLLCATEAAQQALARFAPETHPCASLPGLSLASRMELN